MEETITRMNKEIDALNIQNIEVVVLANGEFPIHHLPLSLLQRDIPVVCCDGAIEALDKFGKIPLALIGDGDSVSESLKNKYLDHWHFIADQETNDLTKAMNYCIEKGYKNIAIIGATGKREDHTLANISLLIEYARKVNIRMFTDYGVFTPIFTTTTFQSFAKQQVSIFSIEATNKLTSQNLRYPIENRQFKYWWEGSLNEAVKENFTLFTKGEVIIYQTYEIKA
jgi:thiamine pyrophosphokinase